MRNEKGNGAMLLSNKIKIEISKQDADLQVFALWERNLYNKRTRYDQDVPCVQTEATYAFVAKDVSLCELRLGVGSRWEQRGQHL